EIFGLFDIYRADLVVLIFPARAEGDCAWPCVGLAWGRNDDRSRDEHLAFLPQDAHRKGLLRSRFLCVYPLQSDEQAVFAGRVRPRPETADLARLLFLVPPLYRSLRRLRICGGDASNVDATRAQRDDHIAGAGFLFRPLFARVAATGEFLSGRPGE